MSHFVAGHTIFIHIDPTKLPDNTNTKPNVGVTLHNFPFQSIQILGST